MRPRRAATSPRGKSRRSSRASCARRSARCGDPHERRSRWLPVLAKSPFAPQIDPQQYILSDRARSGLTGGAAMSRNSKLTIGIATLWLAGVLAISAQDKYAVKVPNGLPFSDFKGYEDWQIVAVSQTDDLLKAMVANPTMIAAYKSGIPGNGKSFPDGSKIAKIEWKPKKST